MPRLTTEIAAAMEQMPVWRYDGNPWTVPVPTATGTVALVSTAGLLRRGDMPFASGETAYREIPADVELTDLLFSHGSIAIDRTAVAKDLNVIFPLDRLREMASTGEIGAVSPVHYSFGGGIFADLAPRLYHEVAPAVTHALLDAGVDIVVLSGACPGCTQAVATLAGAFEAAGLATIAISQLRMNSERLTPPRTLYVPFDFGRPYGAANDPPLQLAVLRAGFALLDVEQGPVIEDFPDDHGDGDSGSGELEACSIMILPPGRNHQQEHTAVLAWYERSLAGRDGRTTVGLSGLGAEELLGLGVEILGATVDTGVLPEPGGPAQSPAHWVRLLVLDLRALYLEAAIAQPGAEPTQEDIELWFWTETDAGTLLRRLRDRLQASDDPADHTLAQIVVPPGY